MHLPAPMLGRLPLTSSLSNILFDVLLSPFSDPQMEDFLICPKEEKLTLLSFLL
jgi:hypothetical protein